MLHYLQDVSHESLEELVPAVAQEAVCVQRVIMAIKTQLLQILFVLHFILSLKCDLSGRSAEIKRPHRGSAGAQPAPHETILWGKSSIREWVFLRGDYTKKSCQPPTDVDNKHQKSWWKSTTSH